MPKLALDRRILAQLLQNNQQAILTFERVLSDVGSELPSTVEEANALAGQALSVAQVCMSTLAALAEEIKQFDGEPVAPPMVDPDDAAPVRHLGTLATQNHDAVEIKGGNIDNTEIGATSTAPAKVTTLSASGQVLLNPASANVEIKPTGAGTVVIAPAAQGMLDNVNVGSATQAPGRFTTLRSDGLHSAYNGVRMAGPATPAAAIVATFSWESPVTRYYVGDGTGYSFRLAKRAASVTTDVATITDQGAASFAAGFGCNGKAAQASAALGAAATDAATTQTLVNNIRAALIANGIGA